MPTGPSSSSYIIPPLTLSDTFYEWYKLTNDEIIDKLNRMKVYGVTGSTGIGVIQTDDGIANVYLATIIPGDHNFTGNITFDGTVTTVNTNLITIDDYNLVLGAVGSSGTGGTNDTNITTAGGGGLIIAGSSGNKYFLWKETDAARGYSAWRISDALAFTGDARFYSNNNTFRFIEGNGATPASSFRISTPNTGLTIDVQTSFTTPGLTYTNINFLSDGSSRMIDSSLIKRFTSVSNISAIGITFGSVVRHDPNTGGLTLAQANNVSNAESIGIAVAVNASTQIVDVNLLGYVGGTFSGAIATADAATSLGTGEFYFLSASEPGKITKTSPSNTDEVRKPILYALGGNKAMVMNYVGNKIANIDNLYSKLAASTIIINHDAGLFSVGDVVRFEEGVTSASRPYGSYVKATATEPELAEALGVISKTSYGGSSTSSLLTISGFIDLAGMGYTLSPGMVYYLSTNPGKLTDTPPVGIGNVRKPMLVALSPSTAIVQNYVGLVNSTPGSSSTSTAITEGTVGFRNKLINGNFDVWQRGTTFSYKTTAAADADRYCADRWKLVNSGASNADKLSIQVNRVALPLGILPNSTTYSKYAMEFDIGTGGYTSNSETYLYQRVEGIEHLPSGYATISFYAKASDSRAKLGIGFRRDFGGGTAPDGLTSNQKVPGLVFDIPADRWTKFTHTFTLPDSVGGVVGTNGNDGPEIRFYLRAGTTFAGKDVISAIDPNIPAVSNYKIQIAQVQLEEGMAATPFFDLDPQTELNRCMRYYQTTSNIVPFRTLANAFTANQDSVVLTTSTISPRYIVPIRNGSSSTVTFYSSPTTTFTGLTYGNNGFRASRNPTGTTPIDIHYQVESEL